MLTYIPIAMADLFSEHGHKSRDVFACPRPCTQRQCSGAQPLVSAATRVPGTATAAKNRYRDVVAVTEAAASAACLA